MGTRLRLKASKDISGYTAEMQKIYTLARAYDRVYDRCGLEWYSVESDVGAMGGSGAHEYMAPCPAGENDVALSSSGYAANVEIARRAFAEFQAGLAADQLVAVLQEQQPPAALARRVVLADRDRVHRRPDRRAHRVLGDLAVFLAFFERIDALADRNGDACVAERLVELEQPAEHPSSPV